MSNHPNALKDTEPVVFVSELADSSVNLAFRVWSKTEDYWDLFFDVNEKIKKELENAKIEIPFPQRVVWMHQEN